MQRTVFSLTIALFFTSLHAQDFKIAHYPFYRDGINPGSFMQANEINALLLYNNEFSGFSEKPVTQVADVSFTIQGHKIGLSFENDVIGYSRKQNIKLRFAKRFALSDRSFFSMGLGTGVVSNIYETTKLVFEDEGDPLGLSDFSQTRLDFDFGVEFQFGNLFVGASARHINKAFSNPDNESPIAHYFTYAQYAFNSGNTFSFYPNVLMRVWKNTFWGEAGVLTFYKDAAWLGFTYSGNHDLTVPLGMRILKNAMFGYAFKANMNSNIETAWNTTSHEVFLNVAFNKNKVTIKTPRFID